MVCVDYTSSQFFCNWDAIFFINGKLDLHACGARPDGCGNFSSQLPVHSKRADNYFSPSRIGISLLGALRVRRLVRLLSGTNDRVGLRDYPLVILPTTEFILNVLRQMALKVPLAIVADKALMDTIAPELTGAIRTPLELWTEVKNRGRLPFVVVSLQDQLVGDGAAYQRVTMGRDRYLVTIFEVMLQMRFDPPTYVAHRARNHRRLFGFAMNDIVIRTHAKAWVSPLTQAGFEDALLDLMQPVIEYCEVAGDSLASWNFCMKSATQSAGLLLARLIEIETFLRMYRALIRSPEAQKSLNEIARAKRWLKEERSSQY